VIEPSKGPTDAKSADAGVEQGTAPKGSRRLCTRELGADTWKRVMFWMRSGDPDLRTDEPDGAYPRTIRSYPR
jgi:hypothetical protein